MGRFLDDANLFALANAGVALDTGVAASLTNSVAMGIIGGLVIGKQIGITLFAWIAVRFGIAQLPGNLTWRHIYGISLIAGIGFTMSLFIASLAFGNSDLLSVSKVGILTASGVAGVAGWLLLVFSEKIEKH